MSSKLPLKSNAHRATEDAVLDGALKLAQPAQGHRAGHDAILLAAVAPAAQKAADFGAGVGTAGLALLARNLVRHVTLVEIDPTLAAFARDNAARNGFANRAEVITCDVQSVSELSADGFDLVIMNPPFNDEARHRRPESAAKANAYMSDGELVEGWIAAAHRACKSGGAIALIHRPEATLPILKSLEGRFGAIEIVPVFPKPGSAAIRLIMRAIKGRKTPTKLLPGITLCNTDGSPSEAAEKILRGGAALARD